MTEAQYGQTDGDMQWRQSRLSSGTSGLAIPNMLLGVPPSNVIEDSKFHSGLHRDSIDFIFQFPY
jgi:hypothetical protein